jgi:hypothetical protein
LAVGLGGRIEMRRVGSGEQLQGEGAGESTQHLSQPQNSEDRQRADLGFFDLFYLAYKACIR